MENLWGSIWMFLDFASAYFQENPTQDYIGLGIGIGVLFAIMTFGSFAASIWENDNQGMFIIVNLVLFVLAVAYVAMTFKSYAMTAIAAVIVYALLVAVRLTFRRRRY